MNISVFRSFSPSSHRYVCLNIGCLISKYLGFFWVLASLSFFTPCLVSFRWWNIEEAVWLSTDLVPGISTILSGDSSESIFSTGFDIISSIHHFLPKLDLGVRNFLIAEIDALERYFGTLYGAPRYTFSCASIGETGFDPLQGRTNFGCVTSLLDARMRFMFFVQSYFGFSPGIIFMSTLGLCSKKERTSYHFRFECSSDVSLF